MSVGARLSQIYIPISVCLFLLFLGSGSIPFNSGKKEQIQIIIIITIKNDFLIIVGTFTIYTITHVYIVKIS